MFCKPLKHYNFGVIVGVGSEGFRGVPVGVGVGSEGFVCVGIGEGETVGETVGLTVGVISGEIVGVIVGETVADAFKLRGFSGEIAAAKIPVSRNKPALAAKIVFPNIN